LPFVGHRAHWHGVFPSCRATIPSHQRQRAAAFRTIAKSGTLKPITTALTATMSKSLNVPYTGCYPDAGGSACAIVRATGNRLRSTRPIPHHATTSGDQDVSALESSRRCAWLENANGSRYTAGPRRGRPTTTATRYFATTVFQQWGQQSWRNLKCYSWVWPRSFASHRGSASLPRGRLPNSVVPRK